MIMKTMISGLLLAVVMLCNCNHPKDVAGGASDQGNAMTRITGRAVDGNNNPATGADVYLRDRHFLADTSSAAGKLYDDEAKTVHVDGSGNFVIENVDPGQYSIEINDRASKAAFTGCNVESTLIGTDINLQTITLKPTSVVSGVIDRSGLSDSVAAYVMVYGLDKAARMDDNGSFSLPGMPEGTMDLKVIFDANTYVPRDSIKVQVISDKPNYMGLVSVLPEIDSTGMDVSIIFTDSIMNEDDIRLDVWLAIVQKPDDYQWSNTHSPDSVTMTSILDTTFSPYDVDIRFSFDASIVKIDNAHYRITWHDVSVAGYDSGIYVMAVGLSGITQEYANISDIQELKRGIPLGVRNPWAVFVK